MTVDDRQVRRRVGRSSARQARILLASEGVVASYINDLSTRARLTSARPCGPRLRSRGVGAVPPPAPHGRAG